MGNKSSQTLHIFWFITCNNYSTNCTYEILSFDLTRGLWEDGQRVLRLRRGISSRSFLFPVRGFGTIPRVLRIIVLNKLDSILSKLQSGWTLSMPFAKSASSVVISSIRRLCSPRSAFRQPFTTCSTILLKSCEEPSSWSTFEMRSCCCWKYVCTSEMSLFVASCLYLAIRPTKLSTDSFVFRFST